MKKSAKGGVQKLTYKRNKLKKKLSKKRLSKKKLSKSKSFKRTLRRKYKKTIKRPLIKRNKSKKKRIKRLRGGSAQEDELPEWDEAKVPERAAAARADPIWVPDKKAARCMLCNGGDTGWTFWSRGPDANTRHHCRSCGWVVCRACMPKGQNMPLDRWVSSTARHNLRYANNEDRVTKNKKVCTSCFEHAGPEVAARMAEEKSRRRAAEAAARTAQEEDDDDDDWAGYPFGAASNV